MRSRWSSFDGGWARYVPVAQRRAKAAREARRREKKGEQLDPVIISGRNIATTFWGKAWCDHMESYHDFENRLPRGRTYARNGSVIHLQIVAGRIEALVNGSALYNVNIEIPLLTKAARAVVIKACAGAIDSVVELLAGRLADGVMNRLCLRDGGLFPGPRQLKMSCSCPDWATMCKHAAAVLYGVGARLDREPALLFLLRGVSQEELITHAVRSAGTGPAATATPVVDDDLGTVFGIDLEMPGALGVSQPVSPHVPATAVAAPAPPGAGQRRGSPRKARTDPPAKERAGSSRTKIPPHTETFLPKRVSMMDLLDRGIPLSTIHRWIDEGLLQPTTQRRIYLSTPSLEKKLKSMKRSQ